MKYRDTIEPYPKPGKGIGYWGVIQKIAMFNLEKKGYEHAIVTRRTARKIAKTIPNANIDYKVLGTVALLHDVLFKYSWINLERKKCYAVKTSHLMRQLYTTKILSENQYEKVRNILANKAYGRLDKNIEARILKISEELLHG